MNKKTGKCFINSEFFLEDLAEALGKRGKDIRGTFLFLENMDEKTLFDAIDKKILARARELPEKKE